MPREYSMGDRASGPAAPVEEVGAHDELLAGRRCRPSWFALQAAGHR